MIEQALSHHLQAVSEIPEDVLIPPRFVIGQEAEDRLLERLASNEAPNQAMQALFDDPIDAPPSEHS
ncbi:hypothetical protein G3446_25600 [Thiorhodococcus minor]|uniref:Uncharacterized protein n=1 Tax=Thiorhodococcus minor TaxID=57489 RepID=A0A6M0K602_9GAMM|nr:hypothetical protein [Thiorhodococcus minor]